MKKISMEETLAKFDIFLKLKKPRDKNILLLLPLLFFGFISYEYIMPSMIKTNKKIAKELRSLTSEMSTYKELVSETSAKERKSLESEKLKNEIAALKDLSMYIDAKLESMDFIYFNSSNRSSYLHRLVTNATNNKIDMGTLSNIRLSDEMKKSAFKPVLSVDFNATGSFGDIVSFIKDIETDVSISSIDKLTLKSGDKISADLTISVWGIEK